MKKKQIHAQIFLLTKENCPGCVIAKRNLEKLDFPFEEIDVENGGREIAQKYNLKGVPWLVVDKGGDNWIAVEPTGKIEKLERELKEIRLCIS